MLIAGSIFTLGFYTITRGEIKILPNGNEIEEKEIFGAWQIFWEEIKYQKKNFYEGDQLEFKLKILEQLKPAYMGTITFSTPDRKSLYFENKPTDAEVRDIEFVLNCHTYRNEFVIFFYDNIPVYRFPEWVRKITNCYTCFAGIGGTISYWTLLFYYPNIFELSSNPTSAKYVFWVIYCISLSFLNKTIKEFFASKQN